MTVLLRRRAEVPAALVEGPQTISTSELGDRYGADPADAQLVSEVLGAYGLTVTETHLASRRLKVSGTIAAMQAAFGTTLTAVTSPHPDGSGHVQHRYRTGSLSVPAPAVRDHHRRARPRRPAAGPPAVPPRPVIRRQGDTRPGGRNRRSAPLPAARADR